jgi:hypothetical protein
MKLARCQQIVGQNCGEAAKLALSGKIRAFLGRPFQDAICEV